MIRMSSNFRTRAALALIFMLTLGARLAYDASNPFPRTGPWVNGALAHNIVSDGHWFQFNANAGPHFAFNAPLKNMNYRVVAPDEVNLRYADTHPRWVPFIWEPVGEVVLLAGLWDVIGSQSYLPDVLMKVILDACAALLVYRIVILLFRRQRAALGAALLYALYPPIAEVVVNPNRDFWSIDLTIAILAIYLEMINSKRPLRWLMACGILTGICAYFDPALIILPGALAFAGVAITGWRTALRRACIITAIAVLMSVPWVIRNYNDFHKFIPFHTGVGTVLWQGLGEISNPYGPVRSDYTTYLMVHRNRPGIRWLSPTYDSYLGSLALALIERHPLFYLRTVAHRIWISTLAELDQEWTRRGTTTPFAYPRGPIAFVLEHPFQLLELMLMPLVFLLAMLSLGFTWSRYKREQLLLVALAVTIALPYLILAADPRYTMPMTISYLIWIGLGSDLLLERLSQWRADRRDRTARAALAA
jgi:4-amino-4-deoxy-L-arabinose transferase-like glycosyltransferase